MSNTVSVGSTTVVKTRPSDVCVRVITCSSLTSWRRIPRHFVAGYIPEVWVSTGTTMEEGKGGHFDQDIYRVYSDTHGYT